MISHDPEWADELPEPAECPACGGPGELLGVLGALEYFRCRACGLVFSGTQAGAPPERSGLRQ